MDIGLNNNISFGKLVSTPLLLRAGSGVMKFEEAKNLNNELGVMYSGHIGFHKRAMNIAKQVSDKDKGLAKIFEDLKQTPKDNLESKIKNYTAVLGEKIDIEV